MLLSLFMSSYSSGGHFGYCLKWIVKVQSEVLKQMSIYFTISCRTILLILLYPASRRHLNGIVVFLRNLCFRFHFLYLPSLCPNTVANTKHFYILLLTSALLVDHWSQLWRFLMISNNKQIFQLSNIIKQPNAQNSNYFYSKAATWMILNYPLTS